MKLLLLRKIHREKWFLIIFICLSTIVQGQRLSFQGYVKDLGMVDLTYPDNVTFQPMIHNRLNFRYKITDSLRIKLEVRNRLFFGKLPETNIRTFDSNLRRQNDYFKLSWSPIKENKFLFNMMIDRFYLEWQKKAFELRVGRQRVNWGVNAFWNPNDIFNVYSIYDFDYQERPGSDAVLLRYYTGVASSAEFVAKAAKSFDESIFATMVRTNKWKYDFQFIAGKSREDLVAGVGWAGNISNAGFKGEFTFFQPYQRYDSIGNGAVASVGADYSFSEKFYMNLELLYNSFGKNNISPGDFARYTSSTLSAKELSPTKFSFGIQPVYKINLKYTASISSVWYLVENAFYVSPMFSYNMHENLDLDFIGQMIYSDITGEYKMNSTRLYIRFKWSF